MSARSAYRLFVVRRRLDVLPLLHHLAEVHLPERQQHLSDLVVLAEAVEVVDREHERLARELVERHLNARHLQWVTLVIAN